MTRKKAVRLAVEAIERRQMVFVVGYNAHESGYKAVWTERDYKKYVELEEAKERIADD